MRPTGGRGPSAFFKKHFLQKGPCPKKSRRRAPAPKNQEEGSAAALLPKVKSKKKKTSTCLKKALSKF
jgi:hypothetical protein